MKMQSLNHISTPHLTLACSVCIEMVGKGVQWELVMPYIALVYITSSLFLYYRSRGAFFTGKYAHRVGMQVSSTVALKRKGCDK